jgi:hypothetical protein
VLFRSISIGGVRLRPLGTVPAGLKLAGQTGTLMVENGEAQAPSRITVTTRRVATDEQGVFWGMQFKQLTSEGYLAVAEVMYGHASVLDRFRERRRSGKSLMAG